jgi:YD repeat-containing protein
MATSRAYDDGAHTVRITDGRGSVLLERYNGQDEVISSTVDPDGIALTTTYRYDGNGNLTDTIDPLNGDVDVLTEYDALSRPILMTKPLRGTAETFYDGNSNVVRQVDGRGVAQRFVYDDLNRKTDTILVESISNGGAELTMQHTDYLDATNRTVQTDASGAATTIQHDAMHRDTLITNDQRHIVSGTASSGG